MVNFDLSSFFIIPSGQSVIYSIDRFPPGLTVTPTTGMVSGQVMNVPINTPFLVSATATNPKTKQSATEYFPITIVVASETEATQEGLVTKVLSEADYLSDSQRLQTQQWLQFIIQEHFACVYIFNGVYPPAEFGGLPAIRKANTGFSIYNFENYVIICMGDKAFADGGNRGRMIRTLEEVYSKDIPEKNWPAIGLVTSDDVTMAKAWVVGKLMKLPVSDRAPNDEALFNYRVI